MGDKVEEATEVKPAEGATEVKETVKEVEEKAEEHAEPKPQGEDSLKRIEALEQTVSGLIDTVSALTPDPTDQTPTNKPWTHRWFGNR